jgi:hypothetical protein
VASDQGVGVLHARGEITLKTTVVKLPDEPPEIDVTPDEPDAQPKKKDV